MITCRFKVVASKPICADPKYLVDFELEVSSYVDLGWELHGPMQIDENERFIQALFLPLAAWEAMNGELNVRIAS